MIISFLLSRLLRGSKKLGKTIFLLLMALCLGAHVQAQTPLPTENTLNATGNTITGGGTTYSYSVGEVAAFSFSNSCSFTQGVIQSNCIMVSVIEAFDEKYKAWFFPNPTSDQIVVETDFTGFEHYQITTADGRLVETGNFNYSPIGFGKFQSGTYYLRLLSADSFTTKTTQIFKQ